MSKPTLALRRIYEFKFEAFSTLDFNNGEIPQVAPVLFEYVYEKVYNKRPKTSTVSKLKIDFVTVEDIQKALKPKSGASKTVPATFGPSMLFSKRAAPKSKKLVISVSQ